MYYFSNLFWYRTLHVSDRFTVQQQESNTVYTATGIWHASYADCLLAMLLIDDMERMWAKNAVQFSQRGHNKRQSEYTVPWQTRSKHLPYTN